VTAPVVFGRLSAGYRDRPVLFDVTAECPAGAVTGLVGPNGAGKTTLLRTALRLVPVVAGTVAVEGRPLATWSREGLARAIAYLPQGSDAHWPVTARTLVALGRLPHRAAFAALSTEDEEAIDDALARCDASDFAARRIDELSSGERARVLLARALATQSSILIADEPAAHLDPAHQLRLMELLREEARRGAAVAVTLHDLALASRFCDSVLVLDRGRLAGYGPPHGVLSDEILRDVFGIEAWNPARFPADPAPVVPWRRL
jgi:iron complex transport system ATP-binding protein